MIKINFFNFFFIIFKRNSQKVFTRKKVIFQILSINCARFIKFFFILNFYMYLNY